MRWVTACLCFAILYAAQAEFIPQFVIDDFEVDTTPLVSIVPDDGSLPVQHNKSDQIDSVLGGERDLIIVTESGPATTIMTAAVHEGAWRSSSSGQASGFSSLQYDGLEGSDSINHDGLNCFDLTIGGLAGGFLLKAQATFSTDFKFTVFGNDNDVASVAKPVITNEPTYYYVAFDTFQGSVDFTCVGAIEITATIQSFSQFVVDTLVVGTYNPESPSHTSSPSPTPTPTSTPSRVASEYIAGPVSATPTHSPLPTVAHDCVSNDDCSYLSSACVLASCIDYECVVAENPGDGCCSKASDCEPIDCKKATCNSEFECEYIPVACIDNQSPTDDHSDGDKENGWIVGVVFGSIGIVVLLAVIVLVIVIIIMKKRSANSNSTSVYDAMIGDM